MVDKVNGSAKAGEFLGKQLDFFSVTAIALSGGNAAANKKVVEKLIETISINGQPIMLSGTLLGATADGAAYTLKFATEHTGSNASSGLVADRAMPAGEALQARMRAITGDSTTTVAVVTEL
jgi:hypothetical protein